MSGIFANGHIVDAILVLVGLEGLFLVAITTRGRGFGTALLSVVPNLLSGAFLLLALRAALVEAQWSWIAVFLALALIAHLADILARARVEKIF
jgi:hypothetical protein